MHHATPREDGPHPPVKISIITPSFNQAQYLEGTIASVLEQGYRNLEYIIIDGGSTDGSVDIIKKYSDRLAYWCSEPDRGQAHALNKGLRRATGDVIGWINSDDAYFKDSLACVAQAFQDNTSSDALYGGIVVIDQQDRPLDAFWPCSPNGAYTYHVALDIHQQGLFWKRSVHERIGYFDEELRFIMDRDFILRLILFCKIGRVPRFLGMFRHHPEAKTSRIRHIGAEEDAAIRRRYASRFAVTLPRSVLHGYLRVQRIATIMKEASGEFLLFKMGSRLSPSIFGPRTIDEFNTRLIGRSTATAERDQ